MHNFLDLEPAEQTLQRLLQFLQDFGPRFRLTYRGAEWSPRDLLAHLQHQQSAVLETRCTVYEAPPDAPLFDWTVTVLPSSSEGHGKLIDWLAFRRVLAWLGKHPDLHRTLEIHANSRQSPFLATYYQAMWGQVPAGAELARLPLWFALLEDLFSGLLGSQERCTISLATIYSWMGAIASFSHQTRWDQLELDDGEPDWPPLAGDPSEEPV